MDLIKPLAIAIVLIAGFATGMLFSPEISLADPNREICRHCTGECITATFENTCTRCTRIPELCIDF